MSRPPTRSLPAQVKSDVAGWGRALGLIVSGRPLVG